MKYTIALEQVHENPDHFRGGVSTADAVDKEMASRIAGAVLEIVIASKGWVRELDKQDETEGGDAAFDKAADQLVNTVRRLAQLETESGAKPVKAVPLAPVAP